MGTLIAVYSLIAIGFILCFVGKFPGQILAYAAMLIAYFGLHINYPVLLLILCGVVVIVSLIINKTLVPKLANKVHEYGKAGRIGTMLGSIAAIGCVASASNNVVAIIILFVLPYVLAFLFEFIASKSVSEGAKRGAGAYVVFLASTLLNVAICGFCLVEVAGGWA